MSHAPTTEQAAIVTAAKAGQHLVVEAGAGTGKTSTLKLLARAKPGQKGVYLAYNKAIAAEAQKSFPTSVVCKTAHSFAFGSVGVLYKHRLDAPRLPARDSARLLGIFEPLALGTDVPTLAPQQVARIVMATVERFCQSADYKIERVHVPLIRSFELPAARAALAKEIVPLARKAWEDITWRNGRLRFTHDCYLKMWQLSDPDLRTDYVLLDEAQDSNPAVSAVVEGQVNAQRILVGDRCQAIYGWRGAVDAMRDFTGNRLFLSQSFRFGPAIAAEANKWLSLLDAQLRLTGYDAIGSRVERLAEQDAILCRSNGGALSQVFNQVAAGRSVALVGGGDDMRRYAEAAQKLLRGQPCDHPELLAFSSWAEVRDYVDQDSGGSDLKVIVALIDKHGPDAIINISRYLVPESQADVTISTAHKSKGREWNRVRIADDFHEPRPNELGQVELQADEAMLAYVAVTRAQHVLDREGLSWVDSWVGSAPRRDAFDTAFDAPAAAVTPAPATAIEVAPPVAQADEPYVHQVWISTPRKGIEHHELAEAGYTCCRRSTRTGSVLPLAEVVERFGSQPCSRCLPAEAPAPMPVAPAAPDAPAYQCGGLCLTHGAKTHTILCDPSRIATWVPVLAGAR